MHLANANIERNGDRNMKKILIAVLGLMAVALAPARAADLPAKAPAAPLAVYDWSGFLIGLNVGGGSGPKCWTNSFAEGAPTIPSVSEGCNDAAGPLLGGQVGYRWQSMTWVFGVEAQGDWANLTGSNASLFLTAPQVTNQSKIDGLGLFTGQVGYAWNNVLWFVKGGAAVTSDKYNGSSTATGVVFDQASETRWGGTVGTGIEVGFGPNWSVGAEFDYLFMGTKTLNLNGVPATILSRTESIEQNVGIGLLRVNYHFGGPVVARY
jgi:outer membrane immunogenic protein